MKLQLQVAFISLISLIWFQTVLCGEISNSSATIKWTCTCSSNQGIQSTVLLSNCSNSCNCSLAAGANGDRWTCLCSDTILPKIASEGQDATCFTACNCSAGALNEFQASRRHTSSSKVVVVVIVLLLCITLTIIAFASSIICYFYRKEKCPNDASVLSSEKTLSCNSATNLISNRTSVPETKVDVSSPINPFTGCFYKARFLFHGKPETIRGTIFQFSYFELEYATDNFSNSNLIGLGGSSYVYRGQLRDGRTVAIKRLKDHDGPDADSLFSKEVDLLSRLNHCHVVPMLGYCSELQGKHVERLLVFEYIPNGNLRDCLDSAQGENMNWETRVSIATGAARGLEYLHEAAAPRILHRDVKSTNILLDENWRAKITDLGMAKYLKADGLVSCSGSPARMQGTFGYFAPEYAIVGRASLKSDVFSFGVVLLELITGRQPIHRSSNKGEESLVIWATPRLQDSRRVISELPDLRLKGNFPEEEMHIMAYLAKECLLLDPDARPTMSEVVQILSTIAPDNSRMRNIHAGLYQWSSFNLSKAETNSEGLDFQIKHPIEAEEPWKVSSSRWPTPCPPTDLEAPPISESNGKETVRLSSEYIERLILLSSNARSWRTLDEETVDLVEPRFESFCAGNFKFS